MYEQCSKTHYLNRASCSQLDIATQIQYAAKHHIDSFNYIYKTGLEKICKYVEPLEILQTENSFQSLPYKKLKVWIEDLHIGMPFKPSSQNEKDSRLFPQECRIAGKTYGAPLLATFSRQIDNNPVETFKLSLNDIPIMVRSENCHLANMSAQQLTDSHEDCNEFGGYFVLNGLEKIIRMLVLNKRNYPLGFIRNTYINRGPNFTSYACQIKSVREDLMSQSLTLHYVSDGNIFGRIMLKKQEFLIPIIVLLKSFVLKFKEGNIKKSELNDRVEVMIRSSKQMSLDTKSQCLSYLGANFRTVLNISNPEISDLQVGELFIRNHICIHLDNDTDKFNLICFMIQKLYSLVFNQILPDNMDSLCNQEVLLPGHLYLMILKEKIEELFLGIKLKMIKDAKRESEIQKFRDVNYLKKCIESQTSIGKKLEYFLATGNLKSQSGLDLMQSKGYAIIADKLNNMRFLSHFRSIHRGAYFTEMKTTTVRKLLPEQWGFVCPVHTPDGGPCGLLNHISMSCVPLTRPQYQKEIHCDLTALCVKLGMDPIINDLNFIFPDDWYAVLIDGKLIGYVDQNSSVQFVDSLRYFKISQEIAINNKPIPDKIEIGFIPRFKDLKRQSQFSGIYIFTNEARLTRPVKNLRLNKQEWISPLEQIYLSIAVSDEDIRDDTNYQEYQAQNILQAMFRFQLITNLQEICINARWQNKLWGLHIITFLIGLIINPIEFKIRNYLQLNVLHLMVKLFLEDYAFCDYPSGTNAVVAVISYTGYDMEDAMILNKSSYERGFGHGSVYKSFAYDLNEQSALKKSRYKLLISQKNNPNINIRIPEGLDKDGVPHIGSLIKKGNPEFSVYDSNKNEVKTHFHKDQEIGRLEQVALIQNENDPLNLKFQYKIRYPRNPVIGDKFSSRHGQKGVLSVLWPTIDMPFSESGIVPDVIINPNAFPSRMTIGMLIESMAGKSGALSGHIQETHPFRNYENDDPVKHFGDLLQKAGYNYYGNEVMYSGIYGTQMKAEIFMGVVYYQRLRHMVSDKSQARSTGPVDVLTQQPVKGRKKYGGIRLGEMERDAIISHGISYCMHDRLMNCSDYSEGYICMKCGSILSSYLKCEFEGEEFEQNNIQKQKAICKVCEDSNIEKIAIPFVLRYLTNELAAMNIKFNFTVQ